MNTAFYAFRRGHGLAGRLLANRTQDDDISLQNKVHAALRMATLRLGPLTGFAQMYFE